MHILWKNHPTDPTKNGTTEHVAREFEERRRTQHGLGKDQVFRGLGANGRAGRAGHGAICK